MTTLLELKNKATIKFENAETELKILSAKEITCKMLLGVDCGSRVRAKISWRDQNPKKEVRESKNEFLEKRSVEKLVEMFLTENENNLHHLKSICILKLTDKSFFKSKYNKTCSV
jgi:hypothetical protein